MRSSLLQYDAGAYIASGVSRNARLETGSNLEFLTLVTLPKLHCEPHLTREFYNTSCIIINASQLLLCVFVLVFRTQLDTTYPMWPTIPDDVVEGDCSLYQQVSVYSNVYSHSVSSIFTALSKTRSQLCETLNCIEFCQVGMAGLN